MLSTTFVPSIGRRSEIVRSSRPAASTSISFLPGLPRRTSS